MVWRSVDSLTEWVEGEWAGRAFGGYAIKELDKWVDDTIGRRSGNSGTSTSNSLMRDLGSKIPVSASQIVCRRVA